MNILHILKAIQFPILGFVLGWSAKKIINTIGKRIAANTKWAWDDIFMDSASRVIMPLFLIAGTYAMVKWLKFSESLSVNIEKFLYILAAICVIIFVARFTKSILAKAVGPLGTTIPSVSIFNNLIGVVVYGVGALVVLQSLGVSITPVLTALGVGGLAVALALQDTLANFFAGMNIILSKQIHVGDFVRIEGGPQGFVTDITWRNTTIRELPNNMIIFPNSKLAAASFTNFTLNDPELAVLVDMGVAYDSDLEKVERITIDTARDVLKKTNGAVESFEPFIRYNNFGESSINFTVIMRAKQVTDQHLIKHAFVKAIIAKFRMENITIPFPMRTIILQGNGEK